MDTNYRTRTNLRTTFKFTTDNMPELVRHFLPPSFKGFKIINKFSTRWPPWHTILSVFREVVVTCGQQPRKAGTSHTCPMTLKNNQISWYIEQILPKDTWSTVRARSLSPITFFSQKTFIVKQ